MGWARLVTLAVACGLGVAFVWANVTSWNLEDMNAYWNAAQRLRDGLPLFPVATDPGAPEVFRYAPWFAWLWVPLTYLPKVAVQIGWTVILIACVVFVVGTVLRRPTVATICLAALLGGLLVRTASTGNVHPLLIATLMYGVPRRAGPVWIGVAASLKFAPIAYALVYVGRGEWRRAAVSVLVAAVLVAPALLYDLTNYPIAARNGLVLVSIPGLLPWAVVALLCAGAAIALARSRYASVSASVAVVASIPRPLLYDLTYLLVALGSEPRPSNLPRVVNPKVVP